MFSSLRAEFLLIQQTGTVAQAVNDCFSCVHLCIASENQASKTSVRYPPPVYDPKPIKTYPGRLVTYLLCN